MPSSDDIEVTPPKVIQLTDNFGAMVKRKTKAVIQFFKYSKDSNPSNYYRGVAAQWAGRALAPPIFLKTAILLKLVIYLAKLLFKHAFLKGFVRLRTEYPVSN